MAMNREAPRNDVSQHIMPTSATMVGVCITVIGIVRLIEMEVAIGTIIDDIASGASVLFLASTVLSYVALRSPKLEHWAERSADLVFILGLLLLVMCGLMLTWELGQSPMVRSAAT